MLQRKTCGKSILSNFHLDDRHYTPRLRFRKYLIWLIPGASMLNSANRHLCTFIFAILQKPAEHSRRDKQRYMICVTLATKFPRYHVFRCVWHRTGALIYICIPARVTQNFASIVHRLHRARSTKKRMLSCNLAHLKNRIRANRTRSIMTAYLIMRVHYVVVFLREYTAPYFVRQSL